MRMISTWVREALVLVAVLVLAAKDVAAYPDPQRPYGYQPQVCTTYYKTQTVAVPKYITQTSYQTSYQTQYQTQYVTQTQIQPTYVTETVAQYVTKKEPVVSYVTKTVASYITKTVKDTQYITRPCQQTSGGYGSSSNGGSGGYGTSGNYGAGNIDVRVRNTGGSSDDWVWPA
ncbi:uncharacterized protein LOC121874660 isoform X1 [Homarus americanus]|uniref:uncharacterized protein LOC121874660 isoform X1 n=1 Tax=Homarus americanus TaxID=6706 RepID=UPI001C4468C6|nr:uncharacterized protein LOC121874660 isoform X1 [Homarus americanus]